MHRDRESDSRVSLAEAQEAILAGTFARHTPHTIVTRGDLERELAVTHARGFAIDNEEMEEGVRCLAVPVFDRHSEVVGAISVSGPTSRMTLERVEKFVPLVRKIAGDFSRQLGCETSEASAS